jgi:hypothetical protein
MRRTLVGTVGTWLVASAALTAADFWQEKDFTAWTAQQVERMLTDSPWVRKVTVVIGSLREGALDGFNGGDAGLGGGGDRSPDGGSEIQRVRRVTVTVAWISSLPVRQAMFRMESVGQGVQIPPDRQRQLSQDQSLYTLAVVGLPVRGRGLPLGTIDEIKSRTALKPAGKDRIAPEDVRVLSVPAWTLGRWFKDGDQLVRVEFLFPKTSAIVLDDKEVEFSTKLGDVELTKKFKLADMMVRGQLAL